MADLVPIILAIIAALASGGIVGVLLTHRRELPKARAEARNMDWVRFQAEIKRLDDKIAAQDERIDELEREVTECHAQKMEMSEEVEKLTKLVNRRAKRAAAKTTGG